MAVLPSTETGLATVAVKVSPAELIFEPTAWPRRTVNTVPAGITNALGASGFASALVFDMLDTAEPELPEGGALLGEALLSLEFEAVESAGLLLQPSTKKKT